MKVISIICIHSGWPPRWAWFKFVCIVNTVKVENVWKGHMSFVRPKVICGRSNFGTKLETT